ncbi:YjdF family protein [Bifidobacterium aquikefiricola]|uniref:YjdF family protein n=1 Tax=Bifidobacterium aquikefiricola TaxID=3059038 RepID=A0AB39U698_9BIFI
MPENGRKFSKAQSTVYFDGSFWVCVCERENDGKIQVCRIVFGSEPKDYEVLDYLQKHYYSLEFSTPISVSDRSRKSSRNVNPKRLERMAARSMRQRGISTKAQLALSAARDEHKKNDKIQNRLRRVEADNHRRMLKIQKRKLKHRGH